MNEYQDQALWWELQFLCDCCNEWIILGDYNTREEAIDWLDRVQKRQPEKNLRIKRVTGLPE